jgi:serine/threonine-protein kinase
MTSPSGGSLAALQTALGPAYTLQREIGRGGMATVYLADDTRSGQRVALKVLQAVFLGSVGTDRFLREIKIAALLSHPNIVPMLDSGRAGDVPYYVMPYLDGEALSDRLEREGWLTVEAAVHIVSDVAAALDYAHAKDVLHRDIKPANIILSGGRAMVADFGIGKAITAADQSSLTQTGTAVGTPAYMSLEQAAGDPDVDTRSDIYSLGAVLYEMLAGAPPFVGATVQGVIAARFTQPVPALAGRVPGISEALDAVIAQALARRREDRFPTAAAFDRALREASGTNGES